MTYLYKRPKLKSILWRDVIIFVNAETACILTTENYFIKGRLSEKENEIEALRQQNSGNPNALAILSDKEMRPVDEAA
jgi:hypothetical protein